MMISRDPAEPARILIVDRDPVQQRLIGRDLERIVAVDAVTFAESVSDAVRHIESGAGIDLIVADLATINGAEHLADFARRFPDAVLFAATESASVSSAVEALREGAHDFLVKPLSVPALMQRFGECRKRRYRAAAESGSTDGGTLPRKGALCDSSPGEGNAQTRFVGTSQAMRSLEDQIRRMAASQAPVFITGESGVGKELCAEAVHGFSRRADGPFIAINCSAIPHDLMESEIFGCVRGAFTGAGEDRAGAAELADGGTLFLDEIGDMDLSLQAKLLRFIQTGTVRRLGDTQLRSVNVRFVAATNRQIMEEVRCGHFREDLFYRLHVLPVQVPPLRARRADILPLARHFLALFSSEEGRAFAGFSPLVADCLEAYDWPGNVRQLENVIRRIVVLYDGVEVEPEMVPSGILSCGEDRLQFVSAQSSYDLTRSGPPLSSAFPDGGIGEAGPLSRGHAVLPASVVPFWKEERRIIEAALDAFGGNISRAAAALEIAPSTIYRKRQSWMEKGA